MIVIDNNIVWRSGTFIGKANHLNTVQVITAQPLTDIAQVNLSVKDSVDLDKHQYLIPTAQKGGDVLATSNPYYQDVALYNVFEVELKKEIVSIVSKFRTGRIAVSVGFSSIEPSADCITFKGYFGVNTALPTTGQVLGDYYECEDYNYVLGGVTYSKGMFVVWNGTAFVQDWFLIELTTESVDMPIQSAISGTYELTVDEKNYLASIGGDVALHTIAINQINQDMGNLEDRVDALETFQNTTVPATYETKADATSKLAEAKAYTDDGVQEANGRILNLENSRQTYLNLSTNLIGIENRADLYPSVKGVFDTFETKADATSKLAIKVDKTSNPIVDFAYNPSTHVVTFTFLDGSTDTFDLPLESAIVSASYDSVTKDITFVLQSGSTLVVPLDDLVSGLASETWVTTYFIPKTAIVDNLTTDDPTKVLSAKQGKALQDTTEKLANKAIDFSVINDTKYPTTKAVAEMLLNLPIAELNNHTLREVFEGGNLVVNGDFSNGATGWTAILATQSIVDDIHNLLANTVNGRYFQQLTLNVGDVVYRFAKVKSTSNLVGLADGGGRLKNHSGSGNYEILTHQRTETLVNRYVGIVDDRTSGWDTVYTQYIGAINQKSLGISALTLAQMDYWFNVYQALQVSMANGIFTLFTPKQQEAWITPTLTTATTTYLKYRKDNFGSVIIEGNITVTTAGTNFTLPTGYRPLFAYTVGNLTFNTDGTVVSSATGTQTLSVRFTGGA